MCPPSHGQGAAGLRANDAAGALFIAARAIRQRIRDRSAILFALIIPLGLAAAFSLLIPSGTGFHAAFVVHDADGGSVAAALVEHLTGPVAEAGFADVAVATSEVTALDALDDGSTSVAILIPAGFSEAVTGGSPTTIRLVGLAEAPIGAQIASSVVGGFTSEVGAIQLAIVTAEDWNPGQPLPTIDPAMVSAVQSLPSPIKVSDTTLDRRQADNTTFYAAAMSIMFVFFTTIHGPLGLLGERRIGTLPRLLAAPIRPGSIIVGAALVSATLGLVSMAVLVVATTLLLGATWGPPLFVAALCVAAVIAAMGVSMLVCLAGPAGRDLNPIQYESAGKRRDSVISREGSVELRRALIDLGVGLWLNDPAAKAYGSQLRARGKKGLVIACAMANRANRIAFALVRDQTGYDPHKWTRED